MVVFMTSSIKPVENTETAVLKYCYRVPWGVSQITCVLVIVPWGITMSTLGCHS